MPRTLTSARTPKSAPMRSPALAASSGLVRKAAAGLLAIVGTCLAAGCAAPAQAGPSIKLSSAQVSEPGRSGITDVYVDVQNSGPADELVGARISVGGTVTLRSPVRPGVIEMRTVRGIAIPARSFTGLDPNGPHLLVTDAGKMISGREINITLVFAHAGAITVPAMVTNPATGGASYFLN